MQQSYSTAFYDNLTASPSTFLAGKSQVIPDNRNHHHNHGMINENGGGSALHGVTQLGVGGVNSQQIMSPTSAVLSDCNNPLFAAAAQHQSPAAPAFLSNQVSITI